MLQLYGIPHNQMAALYGPFNSKVAFWTPNATCQVRRICASMVGRGGGFLPVLDPVAFYSSSSICITEACKSGARSEAAADQKVAC